MSVTFLASVRFYSVSPTRLVLKKTRSDENLRNYVSEHWNTAKEHSYKNTGQIFLDSDKNPPRFPRNVIFVRL